MRTFRDGLGHDSASKNRVHRFASSADTKNAFPFVLDFYTGRKRGALQSQHLARISQ